MLGHGSSSDTPGSSTPWLHAGACSLLVQESALLQRLVRAAPQLMPVSQPQLQEVWTQLWSTAAQVGASYRLGTLPPILRQPVDSPFPALIRS